MSTIQDIVSKTKSEKSQKAKNELISFVNLINPELEKFFNSELKKPFGVSKNEKYFSKIILEHIKEHNLRSAKRLRGSFVYYGYMLLGGKNEKEIIKTSMSVELIHTALLIHDDFMDQDDVRRGLPTTHKFFESFHKCNKYKGDAKHFGESMCVNAGDIALLLGHEVIGKSNFDNELKLKAINRTLRGIVNTGFGQSYDVWLEVLEKVEEKDIFDLHHAKTAIYTYENPLHIGAILAGANEEDLNLISKYAIPGGIAFQLQDDILGLFGDSNKTGKSAYSDLKEGKMTLLFTHVFSKCSKKDCQRLRSIWGNKDITEKDAGVARSIVRNTGSFDYSKEVSIKYAKKAQSVIPKMKQRGWNSKAIDYLDGIAQYMIERDL